MEAFEEGFGVNVWTPQPPNAKLVWERSRMVFPFLELAHRAWLDSDDSDGCATEGCEVECSAIALLLDRIARAGPEEKVINSLLYILIDLSYRAMLQGQPEAPKWAPEPYALRRAADFEERLIEELAAFGHQLALLAQFVPSCGADKTGEELLTTVKQVQTTTQLLGSIRATCAESCDVELQAIWGDMGRYGEMWGDVGRCREICRELRRRAAAGARRLRATLTLT